MKNIKIGNVEIKRGGSPFIVAEAGINHNGEMEKAYEMIRVAKKSGVDAIKFQLFKAEEFINSRDELFTYTSQGEEITEPMLDMFKRYEFAPTDWHKIRRRCTEEEIMFFATPQNVSDLEFLLELGIEVIKVGSDDFTNIPQLKRFAATGLPMIVSSGMANLAEIHESLEAIGAFDGYPTALLVCTSEYPTPPASANLHRIRTLINSLPGIPIGFSDHTEGPLAASMAMALGSCIFEKHFTLDRDLPGPDHWFSEDPDSLLLWVSSIRKGYTMLGDGIVRPTAAETEIKTLARRSIVTLQEIVVGEVLTNDNIGLRRPGSGLPPRLLDDIVGLKAADNLAKGTVLSYSDFV